MYKYQSSFAPFMEQMLEKREKQNMSTENYRAIFRLLDKFFIENDIQAPTITEEHVQLWQATMQNNKIITRSAKLAVLHALCLHISRCGFETYVPRFTERDNQTFIPHIYTDDELRRIFSTCDNWKIRSAHKDNAMFVMPAIIRTLYSTGLRVSEATNLCNKDVDLENRQLLLRETKNKHQRMVPICDSLWVVLDQYRVARNNLVFPNVDAPESRFFITASGKSCDDKLVYNWFRTILDKSGIPHLGRDHGPRIHDFRHTFAVHTIKKKVDENVDLYTSLPILSAFLGHKSIYSTEKYVRLTTEVYPQILNQVKESIGNIFPDINTDFNDED